MFIWCPNLMFLASVTGDFYFANFGQVKIDPIWPFILLWTGHSYFTEFGEDMPRKTSQTLPA